MEASLRPILSEWTRVQDRSTGYHAAPSSRQANFRGGTTGGGPVTGEGVMDSTGKIIPAVEAKLGLWDAVSIIVGIIIGVGIFETPADIFKEAPGPWAALGVWVVGGLLALIGAFCFAELATTYPRSGGEYVYLTRAYGPLVGYLFAWAQLTVIRPGSIGALAYIFAYYATGLMHEPGANLVFVLALSSVVVLTAINILGVVLGSATQNILTLLKVAGLIALVVVGIGWGSDDFGTARGGDGGLGWFVGAMILVLWTYAGWHEAAYIVAEVRDNRRNIPLALLLGTTTVIVIYLLVNLAYLAGLGLAGAYSATLAADVVRLAWPHFGAKGMSLLIIVSALGGMNGMIFTTARIYAEFGKDHRLFSQLSHWSRRMGTPVRALMVQGVTNILLLLGMWAWGGDRQTFETLINYTAAVFWVFFLLTGLALLVLRHKDADLPRPFRVPFYPLLPLIFCGCCAFMVYGAVQYKPRESVLGLGVLLVGLPFYFWPQKKRRQPAERELEPVG
jgi:amino acid transporter